MLGYHLPATCLSRGEGRFGSFTADDVFTVLLTCVPAGWPPAAIWPPAAGLDPGIDGPTTLMFNCDQVFVSTLYL